MVLVASLKGAVKQGGGRKPIPQRQEEWKFLKSLAPPLMAALLTLSPLSINPVSHARAIDVQKGVALFRKTCIGCHDADETELTQKRRYTALLTLAREECRILVRNVHPGGQCTFGARLQDEEIKMLAEFVKLQADQN